MEATTLTECLVDLATGDDVLSQDSATVARQCLLDWLGVAIVGAHEPAVDHVIAEAIDRGGEGRSIIVGRLERLGLLDAALANGVAGHILDYDDAHPAIYGHGTAAILPAALSCAEGQNLSVRVMLDAFGAGYDAAARMGLMLGPEHYNRGYHLTATAGIFGATVASARLLKLDRTQARHALGMAATMAGGLVANFGSMSKSLHAGRAASCGLLAARLARHGFTAREEAIEGPGGFIDAVGGERQLALALAAPPHGHHLCDTLFKLHASCYGTHSSITAAGAALRRGVTPKRIVNIDLWVPERARQACSIAHPATGLEAKFSVSYLVAMVLHGFDTHRLDSFPELLPSRPDVQGLADRIQLHYVPQRTGLAARLELRLDDGSLVEQSFDSGMPERDLAGQQQRLETKFVSLAGTHLESEAFNALLAICRGDDLQTTGAMMVLTRPPTSFPERSRPVGSD